MRLYIIGNGFDLHHDLKTSFESFYQWLREKKIGSEFEIASFFPRKGCDLWSGFEANLETIDEQRYKDSRKKCSIDGDMLIVEGGRKSLNALAWIREIRKSLYDWSLSISAGVDDTLCRTLSNKMLDIDNGAYFFSFNYTSVLEHVYNVESEKVFHVHGKVEKGISNKLILGCRESWKKDLRKDYYDEASRMMDAHKALDAVAQSELNEFVKPVSSIIRSKVFVNFLDSVKNADSVDVIGFSFGEVDMPYIEAIYDAISKDSDCKWRCSWFKEKEKEEFKNKLASIVGEDRIEMIRMEELIRGK